MLHSEDIVEQKLHLYNKLFTPTTIQFKNGTVTAFLMELQYISVDKPSGYSAENAKELLASYDTGSQEAAGTSSDNAQKPNIIVIMNEAFSDPSVLGDFTTNEDYMHSLLDGADNTISGHLNVSVKGGNTANTEFEYLTGASMAFLPYGSIPYQQYVKKETPSMSSYLSSLGYYTIAMHPYRAAGWDRNLVYPKLGFDEMHFQEFFTDSPLVRKYVSDEGNYEKIIKLYEEKDADTPLFLFNVTMQNHSSYSDWADYDNFSPDITVEGSDSKLLPAYLSLIRLSDSAIQNLVSYFEAQEEPTMIVFFGDHQPSLNSSFYRQMNGKGLSGLTIDELEELFYWCTDNDNTLVVNIPPDQTGRIREHEANTIIGLNKRLGIKKGKPLPRNGKFISLNSNVTASSTYGNDEDKYGAQFATDGGMQTRWAAADTVATLSLTLDEKEPFNKISIFEYCDVKNGADGFSNYRTNRIKDYQIEIWKDGKWETIYRSDVPMGDCKVIHFPYSYRTSQIRLNILKASAPPSIYEFNVIYK